MLHVETRLPTFRTTLAADENLRAFCDAFADVRLHAFVLFLRHHRSNGGLGISRITNRKGGHSVRNCPLDGVQPALRYEKTGPRCARLTAVQKGHHERRRDRLLEYGVIEHDGGRLPPRSQRDSLYGWRGVTHYQWDDSHRAGERDLGDVGIA